MRHKKNKRRLSRTTSHRKAMLDNLVSSLLVHQKVETTLPRAKEAGKVVERLITLGKKDDLHHRRQAYSILQDRGQVGLLFDKIAPLFRQRNGGYARIIRSRFRPGDGAQLAILELVETLPVAPKPCKEKAKEKEKPKVTEKPKPAEKPKVPEKPAEKPKVSKEPAEKPEKKKLPFWKRMFKK